jgi:hypothetical protein
MVDDNAPTDVAAGATYTTPLLSPGAGWHVLHAQALDKGFNRSGELLYAFGNGVAVTAPAAGTVPNGPWEWTDDTEMACTVVSERRDNGRIDQDRLATNFAQRCG